MFIKVFLRRCIRARSDSSFPRMIWNSNHRLSDIVQVVRLGQLMADRLPIRVDLFQKTTRFSRSRLKWRVHRDANDVIPWWHYRLPIAAIENKVLAPEEETVRICPAVTDSLISGNVDRPAT